MVTQTQIYIGGSIVILSILGLFGYLEDIGLQVTTSGDFECAGTENKPCISFINVTNPSSQSVYIYNKRPVSFTFSPEIERYALYIKYYGKWRFTNFTMETRLPNIHRTKTYVFVFPAYSTKEFRLLGYKFAPNESIDVIIETNSSNITYTWNATSIYEAGKYVNTCKNVTTLYPNVTNQTVRGERNYTYNFTVCSEGDNTSCNVTQETINYTGITGYNIISDPYNKTECVTNGTIEYFQDTITVDDRCTYNEGNGVLQCDSILDGNGDGICNPKGGEKCKTCRIYANESVHCKKSNNRQVVFPT